MADDITCVECGEPGPDFCPHHGSHCADAFCVNRCRPCVIDIADARDDLDRKYELERY